MSLGRFKDSIKEGQNWLIHLDGQVAVRLLKLQQGACRQQWVTLGESDAASGAQPGP